MFILAVYFFAIGAVQIMLRKKTIFAMTGMDIFISIGGFFLPGLLLIIYIVDDFLKNGLTINVEPATTLQS